MQNIIIRSWIQVNTIMLVLKFDCRVRLKKKKKKKKKVVPAGC